MLQAAIDVSPARTISRIAVSSGVNVPVVIAPKATAAALTRSGAPFRLSGP
jgi:hypothetical protein